MPKPNSYRKSSFKMKRDAFAKKNLNPIPKKVERNHFCPFYGDCLDFAITKSWLYWGCMECRHRMAEDNTDHIFTRDFIASYEIPSGIHMD